jgi:hypothetical protein
MDGTSKQILSSRGSGEDGHGQAVWPTAFPALRRASFYFSFEAFSGVLLLIYSLAAVLFVASAIRYLPVTTDNTYPEAAHIISAQRWAHGLPLYSDYRQAPYLVTAFPPLWYALLALPARLGLEDLDALTIFGRLLNLASLFAVCGIGYLWNRRCLGLSARLSLFAPALYLSFPVLIPWAVTARPDFLSLVCALLGIYSVASRPGSWPVILGAFWTALAFLVRHNAVATPTAIVLWLLLSKRWRAAGLFCLTWAIIAGGTLFAFQLSTSGLLLLNLSGAKFGHLALTYVRDSLFRMLSGMPGHGFAVVLFVFGLLGFLYSWSSTQARSALVAIYLVVSLGLAILGTAAGGADVNHYLEPALALALLAPTGLACLQRVWPEETPFAAFAFLAMGVLLLPSLDIQRWQVQHVKPANLRPLLSAITNKAVFTDVPYLAARMPSPEALDLASLTNAQRTGQWSPAGIIQRLTEGRYDVVIVTEDMHESFDPSALYPRYPHLDSTVRSAVVKNYNLCFERDNVYVYGRVSPGMSSPTGTCPSLATR